MSLTKTVELPSFALVWTTPQIVGTSGAETWVSGKAECLLAIDEDKKVSFLE